jgi:hypothetical protein
VPEPHGGRHAPVQADQAPGVAGHKVAGAAGLNDGGLREVPGGLPGGGRAGQAIEGARGGGRRRQRRVAATRGAVRHGGNGFHNAATGVTLAHQCAVPVAKAGGAGVGRKGRVVARAGSVGGAGAAGRAVEGSWQRVNDARGAKELQGDGVALLNVAAEGVGQRLLRCRSRHQRSKGGS